MSSKTANWIIAAGVILMFIGLCFLPAALGEHPDADLLEFGACQFSLGALIVAGGIYAESSTLAIRDRVWGLAQGGCPPNQRLRGGCDLCGTEAPVVQCKVHQLHLCGNCLAQHYDVRSCAYVPTTRTTTNKSSRGMAANARGA